MSVSKWPAGAKHPFSAIVRHPLSAGDPPKDEILSPTVSACLCLCSISYPRASCGLEVPPCVQAPADVPAPTYRPTYKPSLRGSDDDDCVDDEDWSYTTKEGDVFKCDRVAEKTKRCTIRFSEDGDRADDACKKTCGTCP